MALEITVFGLGALECALYGLAAIVLLLVIWTYFGPPEGRDKGE